MPQPPPDDPFSSDRSRLNVQRKKGPATVLKVLLALFGFGFLLCACCSGIFLKGVFQDEPATKDEDPNEPARVQSGEERFNAANRHVRRPSEAASGGNSEDASNLAARYLTDIKAARSKYFTTGGALSRHEPRAYCHLNDNVCVFLVFFPDLQDFTDDAKAELADLVWPTAQEIIRMNLKNPPENVAVGIRGRKFERVLIGHFQASADDDNDGLRILKSGEGSEKVLYQFFKPDPLPATSEATASIPPAKSRGETERVENQDDSGQDPENALGPKAPPE